MSTPDADPGGYIRFPRAWMALPISPAAKCLLVHFCGAADADGASWYSYAQLAALIGRSRASVAAYVAELRDAGVIETERQRTANGFNYRLRISIARLARASSTTGARTTAKRPRLHAERRQTERRVQPTERKNPSGSETEIHQTDAQATRRVSRGKPYHVEMRAERRDRGLEPVAGNGGEIALGPDRQRPAAGGDREIAMAERQARPRAARRLVGPPSLPSRLRHEGLQRRVLRLRVRGAASRARSASARAAPPSAAARRRRRDSSGSPAARAARRRPASADPRSGGWRCAWPCAARRRASRPPRRGSTPAVCGSRAMAMATWAISAKETSSRTAFSSTMPT
jgi:hypothetical protein